MFLSVKGAVAGVIRGESQDATHANEIEVMSWSWGMHGQRELGSQVATGRAVVHELRIVKRVDRASTALMFALRHNEEIQKAVLTLRKAGRTALEFLTITIEQGRVNTYEVEGGDRSGSRRRRRARRVHLQQDHRRVRASGTGRAGARQYHVYRRMVAQQLSVRTGSHLTRRLRRTRPTKEHTR
jgi:type VI secretion system secreted protein Hcp